MSAPPPKSLNAVTFCEEAGDQLRAGLAAQRDVVPDLIAPPPRWARPGHLRRPHEINRRPPLSRRIRIAYVTAREITQVFVYAETGFPFATEPGAVNALKRLRLDGVPAGYAVENAFHDPVRDAFGLVIAHPSFDLVPVGEVPPTVAVEVHTTLTDEAGRVIGRTESWRDRPPLA